MKTTFQYQLYPETKQKLELNEWLRICRYWYKRQIGYRFDWWQMNRTDVNSCPLECSIASASETQNYYSQKASLPVLKKD
ncbi:helix-turn-helix domain-containing protein [Microseira sp. BLCC-F43]|uniref:helix-turn-helix domain-containing protein n=1 Tax=Microseira sp. BLCC-F43 TaxID=3153602 RepID=UPI0035B8C415